MMKNVNKTNPEAIENGIHFKFDSEHKNLMYWCPECNFHHIKPETYENFGIKDYQTEKLLTKLGY